MHTGTFQKEQAKVMQLVPPSLWLPHVAVAFDGALPVT